MNFYFPWSEAPNGLRQYAVAVPSGGLALQNQAAIFYCEDVSFRVDHNSGIHLLNGRSNFLHYSSDQTLVHATPLPESAELVDFLPHEEGYFLIDATENDSQIKGIDWDGKVQWSKKAGELESGSFHKILLFSALFLRFQRNRCF